MDVFQNVKEIWKKQGLKNVCMYFLDDFLSYCQSFDFHIW